MTRKTPMIAHWFDRHIRLLPVLIVAGGLLVLLKSHNLMEAVGGLTISSAHAADASAPKPDAAGANAKTDDTAPEHKPKVGEAKLVDDDDDKATPPLRRKPVTFTRAEVEVLESLAERRRALDEQASELDNRANLLRATEQRIDTKIAKLKDLEARIEKMLKEYDTEAEKQLKSLVKVYESMKPKDAARIFGELEMDILVAVVERMREVKMAAILANMKAAQAKELTVELATRRQLPKTGG